jgi:hypothetical protein
MTVGVGLSLVLAVLTVLLVVPAGVAVTVVKLRGPLIVVALWWLAVRTGVLAGFDGPFGLPVSVAWVLGGISSGLWAGVTFRIGRKAWIAGYDESRMWLAAKRNIDGF